MRVKVDEDLLLELLERTLTAHDLEALAGAVAVATPRGVRIRRATVQE